MEWINCFKAMPNKHEDVLVWVIFRDKSTEFTTSWIDDDGWAMGSAKGFTVTHWMRIRKPE